MILNIFIWERGNEEGRIGSSRKEREQMTGQSVRRKERAGSGAHRPWTEESHLFHTARKKGDRDQDVSLVGFSRNKAWDRDSHSSDYGEGCSQEKE